MLEVGQDVGDSLWALPLENGGRETAVADSADVVVYDDVVVVDWMKAAKSWSISGIGRHYHRRRHHRRHRRCCRCYNVVFFRRCSRLRRFDEFRVPTIADHRRFQRRRYSRCCCWIF